MDYRVSVILPTYNRAALVARAVSSALNQTSPAHEVIVIDDGSRDETRAALAPFGGRIRYIYQENQGVSAARNRGIQDASGNLVAFLDSDDFWEPWKLAVQLSCLTRFPDLVLIGTNAWGVNEQGIAKADFMRTYSAYKWYEQLRGNFQEQHFALRDISGTLIFGDFSSPMFLGNFFVTSTVLVHRDIPVQAGPFDLDMHNAGEDYDLFWRICRLGKAGVLDVPTIHFRRGGGDHLHSTPQMALSNLLAIERYFHQHPNGPDLASDLVTRRLAESYAWAGRSLFDHDQPKKARPYLRNAIRQGSGGLRLRVYIVLTYMPGWTVSAARWAVHRVKRAARISR